MARKPEERPARWEIFYAGKKAKSLGEIEAVDEREATAKAAEQFRLPAAKIIAVRRR